MMKFIKLLIDKTPLLQPEKVGDNFLLLYAPYLTLYNI